MNILIIERDGMNAQLLRSKLEPLGHIVKHEASKNNALALLEEDKFDVVFFDPAPLNNARPVVLGIRRIVKNYPYLVLTSQDMTKTNALRAGANEMLAKPINVEAIEPMIENAKRLLKLIERVGDDSVDYPSAGGVIAKSAFNQLFLSSIDRADRYAEQSFLLFIGIDNYRDILETDGRYAADFATARLSQYLVRLRRQSDIIAQTDRGEYCLMLQRPMYETEPLEAGNRFAESLGKMSDICPNDAAEVKIGLRLINLPTGDLLQKHILTFTQDGVELAPGDNNEDNA